MPGGRGDSCRWVFGASNGNTPSDTNLATGGTEYPVVSDTVSILDEFAVSEGIMGSPYEMTELTADLGYTVGGQLVLEPSPDMLSFWLPFMTGVASSPFTTGVALDYFDFQRDEDATCFDFRNCVINSWTLSGSSNQKCRLTLDVIGRFGLDDDTFEETSGGIPVAGADDAPLLSSEASISIAGSSRELESWEVSVNRNLTPLRRQYSGGLISGFYVGQQEVSVRGSVIWESNIQGALYNIGTGGVAANITLTRGGTSFLFSANRLVLPREQMGVTGPGEQLWNFTGAARGDYVAQDASTGPLSIAEVT